MEDQQNKRGTSYGNIFKTTFLFGFVQVVKAIVSIVKNKLAAILIGAEGMGILGIYQTVILLIRTGAGFGVNQSAVRDVSEARGADDYQRFSLIITVVNKVIMLTGLIGCIITLLMSYWISDWTFGNKTHVVAYCIIAFVVALEIINESKQAILKGMRQLRALAKSSLIGSFIGLVTTVPLYYFWGKDGIIPELLIASIITVLVSEYYVRKIEYSKIKLTYAETFHYAKPMIKMGTALMSVTFMVTIVAFITNAYIRFKGGLQDVGYYSAGSAIMTSYFGVVITALMTDYYPRIAAINKDNEAIQDELNKQSLVSLVLCTPMFVLFLTLLPFFIKFLYTDEFMPAVNFVKWGIYWTLITVISNQVDMILVAKLQTKTMLVLAVIVRVAQLAMGISLYSLWGLEGLGISYLVLGVFHMILVSVVVFRKYRIRYTNKFVKVAFFALGLAICSSVVQSCFHGPLYYGFSFLLLVLASLYSLIVSKRVLGVDFVTVIKAKIK